MKRTPLLQAHEFFRRGPSSAEGWSQLIGRGREWESFYRDRVEELNLTIGEGADGAIVISGGS